MHKSYGVNELREMFLRYFESKDHLRLPSFSLIPQNDASLLLINSGLRHREAGGSSHSRFSRCDPQAYTG